VHAGRRLDAACPERNSRLTATSSTLTRVLPRLVSAYLQRALPADGHTPRQVRIHQHGQMWLKPNARPRSFTATQHYAVERMAFSWHARFRLAPLIALQVRDDYDEGEGSLTVSLLGKVMQRQRGPEVSAGEAMRYLAELPWVPHAMAHNSELRWRELDGGRVEVVAAGLDATAITLEFDSAGDVIRASSPARMMRDGDVWTATPWGGEFADYRTFGSMRVPGRAEVYWQLPGGRFVYWRGEVTAASALEAPFGRPA